MNLTKLTIGQYVPGNSVLHRLDPRLKLTSLLVLSTLIFLAKGWLGYLLAGILVAVLIQISGVPLKMILRGLRPIVIFIAIAVIFNMFFTPGEPLVKWGWFGITREGLVLAATSSVRLILLVVFASLLTLTTTPILLTDGLERILKPLKFVGVPAHELALMMTIALRFVPTLMDETERVMRAQAARGAVFEGKHVIERVKALLPVLVPLFVGAFRRADELATAMEARAYRGGEGRTRLRQLRYTALDGAAAAVVAAFAGALLTLRYMGM